MKHNIQELHLTRTFSPVSIVILLLLLVIVIIPLFTNLTTLPIRLFDESRLASSALEMNRNNNFLVVHYKGEPEMWSTKPPLLIWCQVICMKFLGENEMAVRLPSAICGLLTFLLLFWMALKVSGNLMFTVITSLILIATPGFITEHGTRTGDYDCMLMLFLFLQVCCFYLFLENTRNRKYWYLTCVAVILAVYTKGIAGLMFLPGLFFYTIFTKQLQTLFRSGYVWLSIASIIVIILSYYGVRELYNPGYIKVVIQNEITYRYFDVNEGHVGEWNFYLLHLRDYAFTPWYIFFIVGIIFNLFNPNSRIRRLVNFMFINSLLFMLVISFSKTKIEWYAIPLYPLLAFVSAAGFYCLYENFAIRAGAYSKHLKVITMLLFGVVFCFPYSKLISETRHPAELKFAENLYLFSHLFQDALHGKENLDGFYYCFSQYNAHLYFYTAALENKGQHIILVGEKELIAGNQVLVGTKDASDYIAANYKTETIREWNKGIKLLRIIE